MENKRKKVLLRALSNKIRLRRFELRLSQEKLGELAGCNVNHIGRIERAQADPSFTMIIRISQALLLSPRELMPE